MPKRETPLVLPWFSPQQFVPVRALCGEASLPSDFADWRAQAEALERQAFAERRPLQRVTIDPAELQSFARSRGWTTIDDGRLLEFAQVIARTEAQVRRRVDPVGLQDRPARKQRQRRPVRH